MEYVQGIPFRELARKRPPPLVAARAIADACRGLHAAHELRDLAGAPMGVVHRDISPENLMLGYDGQVKVLDFGIALVRGRMTVTEHGTIKGKPPYMSPEQARGLALDRRSDVFSIALVLHELLTGEPVFTGESIYAVARAVVEAPIAPPAPTIPGLDAIVMAALARDRDDRTPTAAALADALEQLAAGAESLSAWTARALAHEREVHRAWLADLIGDGTTTSRKPGRHSGMLTARAEVAGPPPAPSEMSASIAPPSRRGAIVGAVVALALLGVLAVILASRCDPGERVAVVADARAARVDAAVPRPSPLDAAAITDATPAPSPPIDASRPPRDAGRLPPIDARTPPPPVDAAVAAIPIDAATPAAKPGFITIVADPFALIRIDGKDWGTTPIYKRRIAVGPHEVELRSPDSGAVRLTRTIQITSGQLERIDLP